MTSTNLISRDRKHSTELRDPGTRTPKHAGKATIRKPNRRRGSIAALTFKRAALVFLAAFFLGAIFPALAITPAHAADITGTPAQEAAACSAVYHFHHMNAIDYGGQHATATARAWYHAWHLAGYADQLQGDSMRYNIRHYLATGRGWSLVAYDCNPDGTGP